MNRSAAQDIVYSLTARALRRLSRDGKSWERLPDIPKNLSEADKQRLKKEMDALADKLQARVDGRDPIDGEAKEVK